MLIMLLSLAFQPSLQHLDDPLTGQPGCMVVYNEATDTMHVYNPDRASTQFLPFSTFKWPHTLIALEMGVIPDLTTVVPWDRERFPPQPWWGPAQHQGWGTEQTVLTAFRRSTVWYYQRLTAEIGRARYQKYLQDWQYGNERVGEPLDAFWLSGAIAISAFEQVDFLRAWHDERLPLRERTYVLAREIFTVEQKATYRLFAKTGAGPSLTGGFLGWYVGVVERADGNIYFAMNITGTDFTDVAAKRVPLTRACLQRLGYLSKH